MVYIIIKILFFEALLLAGVLKVFYTIRVGKISKIVDKLKG